MTAEQDEALARKLRRLDAAGLVLALIGLALQATGQFAFAAGSRAQVAMLAGGTSTLAIALACLAARKGRTILFGLLAVLSCVGFFVVFILPKTCHRCRAPGGVEQPTCESCGAPM